MSKVTTLSAAVFVILVLLLTVLAAIGRMPGGVFFAMLVPMITFALLFGIAFVLATVGHMNKETVGKVATSLSGFLAGFTVADFVEIKNGVVAFITAPQTTPLTVYVMVASILLGIVGFILGLLAGRKAESNGETANITSLSQLGNRFLFNGN